MVTLADKNLHEIGYVKDANFTADVNGEYEFSVQIARSNWYPELNFSSYIYHSQMPLLVFRIYSPIE